MVSMNITIPIVRDNGPGYMTFSLPYDQETAIMQFEARHGCKPETIKEHLGNLMLGPVPEKEIDPGEGDT